MSNAATKTKRSTLKESTQLRRRIIEALHMVAYIPPWPEPVRNPKGGGLNFSMPYQGCGVLPHGTIFAFGVRSWPDPKSYPAGDIHHVSDRERDAIVGVGRRGGVTGLIVCATDPDIDSAFWMPWTCLARNEATIEWEDPRLVVVGSVSDYQFDLRDAVKMPLGIESRVRF